MKRTALLSLAVALAVLTTGVGQTLAGGEAPLNDVAPPRVSAYSNSGCLVDPGGAPLWPCGDDEIVLTVTGYSLHMLHMNATYNCCPDEIVVSVLVEGNMIYLAEEEILTNPCWCMCCYDVEATVVNLLPGKYTVELCWFDFDTNQVECYVEEIVIPPKGPGDGGARGMLPPPNEIPLPRVQTYSNSGCLLGPGGGPFWPCGEDEIVLTVKGNTLGALHMNATYNCCPDDIVIEVSVQGNMIYLTEEEILTNPCYCMCCYDVEATVVNLSSGPYTVEFCWFDEDTHQIECYVEEIVIP